MIDESDYRLHVFLKAFPARLVFCWHAPVNAKRDISSIKSMNLPVVVVEREVACLLIEARQDSA